MLLVVGASVARADDVDPQIEEENTFVKEAKEMNRPWVLNFGYISWEEQLTVNNGGTSDWGVANFSGNILSLQREFYLTPTSHHGAVADVGLMYGAVDAQSKGGILSYSVANVSWSGEEASYRYLYRLTSHAAFSVGPVIMTRQVSLSSSAAGTTATSGSAFNYGVIFDARANLFRQVDFILSAGTWLSNASTLWSLGLGYVF